MTIDMSQFYQVFFDESAEHLAAMETLLLDLDVVNPDNEQLNAIFRAAHSIKGSAGTFGFTDLAETTHILENLLDRIRRQEMSLRAEMVDVFLASGDLLRQMLEAHQGRGTVEPGAVEVVCAKLQQLSSGATRLSGPLALTEARYVSPTRSANRIFDIQFVPTEYSSRADGVISLIEELRALGALEVVRRPEGGDRTVGFWQLRLIAACAPEDFSDSLDFIADNGAWRVTEEKSIASKDIEAFGFFDEAPGAPGFSDQTENTAFGVFDPLSDSDRGGSVLAATESKKRALAASGALPANPGSDSSIRVSVEKVDQLINLVGELVITQSMLLQTVTELQDSAAQRMQAGLVQLERNMSALQESVMSIRMMPISFVFSRFPRVVRDLSAKLGKQVAIKTSGEATELDKGLIERIVDPLTHLIRNSLDHGIESPERRAALGKPPLGTITLKAYHQGGSVVIEVGDDGAGLSRAKILAKACERGMPVSEQMADQEVFNLIFEAGFSTVEEVTDVSGRGVGMDVVLRNIHSMGGRIEIDSMPGVGTRMTVRLPLTLAILDGISVALGEQTYILPLSSVVESLLPEDGHIKILSSQARVILVRGEYLPVVILQEMFGMKSRWADFSKGILVVLDADGNKVVLYVDALIGQHQVVIKSLETNYRRVPGISGATIMGDGRVALILDVPAIAAMARSMTQKTD